MVIGLDAAQRAASLNGMVVKDNAVVGKAEARTPRHFYRLGLGLEDSAVLRQEYAMLLMEQQAVGPPAAPLRDREGFLSILV